MPVLPRSPQLRRKDASKRSFKPLSPCGRGVGERGKTSRQVSPLSPDPYLRFARAPEGVGCHRQPTGALRRSTRGEGSKARPYRAQRGPRPIMSSKLAPLHALLPARSTDRSLLQAPLPRRERGWGEGGKPRGSVRPISPPFLRFARAPKSVGCHRRSPSAPLRFPQGKRRDEHRGVCREVTRHPTRSRPKPRPTSPSAHP